jgi:hypothetical protein
VLRKLVFVPNLFLENVAQVRAKISFWKCYANFFYYYCVSAVLKCLIIYNIAIHKGSQCVNSSPITEVRTPSVNALLESKSKVELIVSIVPLLQIQVKALRNKIEKLDEKKWEGGGEGIKLI